MQKDPIIIRHGLVKLDLKDGEYKILFRGNQWKHLLSMPRKFSDFLKRMCRHKKQPLKFSIMHRKRFIVLTVCSPHDTNNRDINPETVLRERYKMISEQVSPFENKGSDIIIKDWWAYYSELSASEICEYARTENLLKKERKKERVEYTRTVYRHILENGKYVVKQDRTLIEDLTFDKPLLIQANDCIVRNCRFIIKEK